MGLLSKEVEVGISGNNLKYYEDLGYKIPKKLSSKRKLVVPKGTKIKVKVKDLQDGSEVIVNVKCDCNDCKNSYLPPMKWANYKKHVREDGKYYCKECAFKLFGVKKKITTQLQKSESFGYWLIKNLPLKQSIEIILRWDDKLNGCDIREVGYTSTGFNKKGYYFRCPRGIHSSELKNIANFVNGQEGSIYCEKCNSFAQWGIDNVCLDFLEKYWNYSKNIELGIDPWNISYASAKKVCLFCQEKSYHESYSIQCNNFTINNQRCPYCSGHKVHYLDSLGYLYPQVISIWSDKNKKSPYEYMPNGSQEVYWKCLEGKHNDFKRSINSSNRLAFRCPECQYSKGEKKIEDWLINNNFIRDKDYIPQKEFDGLIGLGNGNLSYDFYLTKYNLLIEYDGEFHYKVIKYKNESNKVVEERFKKQQYHDKLKNEYCKLHNIKLIRIPYWEFENVENILNEKIKN